MPATYGTAIYGTSTYGPPGVAIASGTRPALYRWLVEDVIKRQIIGELPLNDTTYEGYLNRPGALPAKLTLGDAERNRELLDVGRRAIYAMRDGNIDWGGLLIGATVGIGATDVDISCVGWPGWFDMRDIWIDRQFQDTDQFEIFRTLVNDAQDESNPLNGAGAHLGITVTWDALSGVRRDRMEDYRYYQGKNLGDALRQLAALDDGFDYSMRYTLDPGGGSIEKTIRLSYPHQGEDRSSQVGFEYIDGEQGNILKAGLSHDVSKMAWRIRGWGTGANVAKLLSTQVSEEQRGIYPFFDGQGQFSSVTKQDTLNDNTLLTRVERDHPVVVPMIEVDPNKDPKWGSYELGDIYNVELDSGYLTVFGPHRIIGYKMNAVTDRPVLYLQAV